ncbi:fasciclin domain-containing protein [Deinococcus sp.]|uniref:fasciclin domain-containing protein n=1 Tax=Deinococcus sp. TaxID=47478 RepID=UPI003CC50837
MKAFLSLPLFAVALSSCGQPSPIIEPDSYTMLAMLRQQPSISIMNQAYFNNLATLSASLSQKDAPVTVLMVPDDSFKNYFITKALTKEQFLKQPGLLAFLKSHILMDKISSDSVYTSLSGYAWDVKTSSKGTVTINGAVFSGCAIALTTPDASEQGYLCYVDSPVAALP